MNESAVTFGKQSLVGVLCSPTIQNRTAIIFVNAGSTHRCGPNRLCTNLARRLALKGHLSLRFDLAGIGDSPSATGLGKFRDYATQQIHEAMDYLILTQSCQEFIIFGLCGGADIAFDAGTADKRIRGLILANGALVDGNVFAGLYHKASRRTASRFYAARIFSLQRWWRLLTFQSKFWKHLGHHKETLKPSFPCGQQQTEMSVNSGSNWDVLAQRQTNMLLVYSEGSIFWDIYKLANQDFLKTSYPANCLTVKFQNNTDHTFTLLSAQERLAVQIEAWLKNFDL